MSTPPEQGTRRFVPAALFLLVLGALQMTGELAGVPALKYLGAVSGASPAPKVFSSVRGLETYSTRFILEWSDLAGTHHELPLTPEVYSRLRGPYNRRNMYGAALAYGPVLVTDPRTRWMFESIASHALCGEAPVLRELGVDPAAILEHSLSIRYEPVPGTEVEELPYRIAAPCEPISR